MSTRAQILAEIAAQFPDNTTGLITPAKLRQVVEDVTNSCLVSDTDAGTAGIAVLQSETAAQGRTALGFGGTVTVAQLNAAGADARSAMYYCSDCLTVNGPGSLVAWCGRTSTWRTLDDCLLATTDFAAWCSDFVKNSNSCEIRGNYGLLINSIGPQSNTTAAAANGGSTQLGAAYSPPDYSEVLKSGATNSAGIARHYSVPIVTYAVGRKPKVFAGIKGVRLSTVASGFTFRVGIGNGSAPTSGALVSTEYSACFDTGNVLGGLNAGSAAQWLACFRSSSVNLSGSGATGSTPSVSANNNLLIVRDADAVSVLVDGVAVATGSATENDMTSLTPFCLVANDGTSTVGANVRSGGFCFGYLLP